MKILYLITKSNWGGAQRNLYDLATSARSKGHEVKAAVGGSGALKERLEAAGIFTYSIASMGRDMSFGKDAGSFREIFSVIKDQRPDVLHLHSPKAAGLGALAGRLLRVKKIVMTVHGWTWNERRPMYERALIVLFSWITALLCHKVIVISHQDYSQAARLPWLRDKLALIPLGIKPEALMSVDGAKQFIAKSIGLDMAEFNKKIMIGSIAELHRNKGLDYLIEAMAAVAAKYPNAVCVIMSDGEDRARLQSLIDKMALSRNFYLIGFVPDAAQYLKALKIFVLPSLKEGLPYVLLEAGAAALSVVATSVGGVPDIVEDMRTGILVQPRNARDLAHALLFTIEHPKESREYAAALKAKVASEFSLDKMLDKVQSVYAEAKV